MLTEIIRNIFRVNLGVRKEERVLVFTDRLTPGENPDRREVERRARLRCLAYLVADIGRGLCREVALQEFPATGNHGAEPPEKIWEAAFGKRAVSVLRKKDILAPLITKDVDRVMAGVAEEVVEKRKDDSVSAVVALSNYSTSHTRFRDLLTRVCGARYASMPLFDMSMVEGPMNVDWKELARFTRRITRQLGRADRIEMSAPNGTRISFSIKGRKPLADTGILTKPGSFGNLPAGEAFCAPREGTASGRLVLEWAPARALKSHVTLVVKNGVVASVEGDEEYAVTLREKLEEREENRNIAEFGVGTNSRARRPDNILETEKILGSVHVALGDNSSFGGTVSTPFHQDFVFFRPTVVLVDKNGVKSFFMRKGKVGG